MSLTDDLARRDFTINAIAYHPLKHEWRDPFAGEADLKKKLIRAVGDPNWRFQEDYLRILRALRFSARFDFRIHPPTLEAAKANVAGLGHLSAERVRDEWFKGIATARARFEVASPLAGGRRNPNLAAGDAWAGAREMASTSSTRCRGMPY